MVNLTIDGIQVEVPDNSTVLDAARKADVEIPTLCFLKGVNAIGACRICMVEVKGNSVLQAACVLPVQEGMEIITNSEKVLRTKRATLDLILSNHDRECLTCPRNQNCELQKLASDFGMKDIRYKGEQIIREKDEASPSVVRDPNKCILCRRCVSMCENIQTVGAIGTTQRGFNTIVEPVWGRSLKDVNCVNCGQCITACPVGALTEKSETERVWGALHDPELHVIVQPAPAVRVALGEEFGMPMGTRVTGKLAAALRKLKFDKVFDTDFGADLTIMEEGYELLNRIKNDGVLPMITSCSPGWIKFCEEYYPDMLDNLSTCKSPHEMLGAIVKTYYAEKEGIDPANIFTVSVMPCTAKKYERQREGESASGYYDVDAVLTTREIAQMIREANIDFANLEDEPFDDMLGDSTGAAVIFGVSGGVMESALRTVADEVTGEDLNDIELKEIRGLAGIKEAEVKIGEHTLNVAVASGLGNARKLLDSIKRGERKYDFIEIMGCPGGCITGGGQPIIPARVRNVDDPRVLRAAATYAEDQSMPIRKSYQNPSIQKLYKDFLGEPNSHKAHEILHTFYTPCPKYADLEEKKES